MALPADEIEEELNLAMINDRHWTIVACSAMDGEGNIIGFDTLFRSQGWNRLAHVKNCLNFNL